MFRIDSRACTADYSLAKKNYPVLSELQMNGILKVPKTDNYSIIRALSDSVQRTALKNYRTEVSCV